MFIKGRNLLGYYLANRCSGYMRQIWKMGHDVVFLDVLEFCAKSHYSSFRVGGGDHVQEQMAKMFFIVIMSKGLISRTQRTSGTRL